MQMVETKIDEGCPGTVLHCGNKQNPTPASEKQSYLITVVLGPNFGLVASYPEVFHGFFSPLKKVRGQCLK
jgi:hypothetical protein